MYEHRGLDDIFYIMLFGAAATLALIGCLYLFLRPVNVVNPGINPPRRLRFWSASFLAFVFLSHVWWVLLGLVFFTDDRYMRNVLAIGLDSFTLFPTLIATLLSTQQDRLRPLWPVAVSLVPIVFSFVILGIFLRSPYYEVFMQVYLLTFAISFTIYMSFALRSYGRWLNDNYADLEHKELWQSGLLLVVILFIFISYKINYGGLFSEYLTQLNSVVLVIFMVWRVETLHCLCPNDDNLSPSKDECLPSSDDNNMLETSILSADCEEKAEVSLSYIGDLLEKYCVQRELYLQHDLSLSQLAMALGTNRTYLSQYFMQIGTNYNAYINQLRIEHFEKLYVQSLNNGISVTAQELSAASGFRSYSTFSAAFKKFRGITVSDWKNE